MIFKANTILKSEKTYQTFTGEELTVLLSSAAQGDLRSFNEISKHVRSISFSYFLSKYKSGKLKNRDDADDLANNVFLAFSDQYRKIENIEHWIRKVLFLTFVNWYKKQKKYSHSQIYENLTIQDSIPNFGDNIDLQKISSIISELKESKQKIIKMRFWEGLKFNEISEKLNKNEAAVKKMLYRTLEEIRNKLE